MSDLITEIAGDNDSVDLADVIGRLKTGEVFEAITLIPPSAGGAVVLPSGVSARLVWRVGDDLVLVMPESLTVLEGAAVTPTLIRAGAIVYRSDELAAEAPTMDGPLARALFELEALRELYDEILANTLGGSGEADAPPVAALVGLNINPLLPPTAFAFPGFDEEPVGADGTEDGLLGQNVGGIGPVGVTVETDGDPQLAETDSPVSWALSDDIDVFAANAGQGEEITQVTVDISGLPAGMLASAGTLTAQGDGLFAFSFSGTLAAYLNLTLTFPTDFSTESRIDAAPGALQVIIGAQSNFSLGEAVTQTVPLSILAEPDLEITGTGVLNGLETDAPVALQPSTVLLPEATDIDGSEFVTGVELTLSGLPADTIIDINGIRTLVTGDYSFSGSLADYSALLVIFPTDFSTENPQTDITGTLTATTNEGGLQSRDLSIVIDFSEDISIVVSDPAPVDEDQDNPGVLVDLDPAITISDQDLSENGATDQPPFGTVVTVSFDGLPATGAEVRFLGTSVAVTDASVISLSVAEARDLAIFLPENFNTGVNDDAPVTVSYIVTTPEGSESAAQTVLVRPTEDIEFDITPIVSRETDAPVPVTPSTEWIVSVSDPNESITNVTLTLDNLPPAMLFQGAPAGTITYDPTLGGQFIFSGTLAEYSALQLVFPTDFSTENRANEDQGSGPGYPDGPLTGTITATSTESGPLPETGPPLSLSLGDEGDVAITTLTPAALSEDNGAAPGIGQTVAVRLDSYLVPAATDQDLSESLDQLIISVTGLPGSGTFALSDILIDGLPATIGTLTTAADGSQTYSLTLTGADTDKYFGLTLNLPDNFSTENRSDLTGTATTLPIALDLTAVTNEGTPAENTLNASTTITVAAEHDITLSAEPTPTADEDSAPGGGATVDLMIDIAVLDTDLSEDPSSTADPRFATVVTIDYGPNNLPAGVSFNGGSFVAATGIWTGNVAEAEALTVTFPPDHSGLHPSVITVTTPEGSVTQPQTIDIKPQPDITFPDNIESAETDAAVPVLLSDTLKLDQVITDPNEGLVSFEFTLTGLPAGTTVSGPSSPEYVIDPIPAGADPVTVRYVYTATDPLNASPFDVTITLPKDYSTTNPPVSLIADVVTVSTDNIGNPQADQINFIVSDEEDLVFIEPLAGNVIALDETDAAISFTPADAIIATAKVEPGAPADGVPNPDQDGSESVDQIVLTITGLPGGATAVSSLVPPPAITQPSGGSFTFTGTRAEYESLSITLPRDFSTISPPTTISGTVRATTDEGGDGTRSFTVEVQPEGDIELQANTPVTLAENDPVGNDDQDSTTTAPVQFLARDAILGVATDIDGSEALARVDNFTVTGLPDGASFSLTGTGGTFTPVPGTPPVLTFATLTAAQYDQLVIRLPDDFSTESPGDNDNGPISGSARFFTDEAIEAGETAPTPTNGVVDGSFSVIVTDEADIRITVADASRAEDTVSVAAPLALNLDTATIDIDNSESLTALSVTFDDLPAGGITLSDGTVLTPGSNVWTPTGSPADAGRAQLQALAITVFPVHYSGRINATVNVTSNEGVPASATFVVDITPVAEPVITLSVDDSFGSVTRDPAAGPDSFSVKEDTTARLTIEASTPDTDGSEELTQIVLENLPASWLPDGDVTGFFDGAAGTIDTAVKSGTTVTITLTPGVTDVSLGLRVSPARHDDRDVETIVGNDLVATVTAVDSAPDIPDSNTAVASDGTDVDVDAVVDGIVLRTADRTQDESATEQTIGLDVTRLRLIDRDTSYISGGDEWSETFSSIELTMTVTTATAGFDPQNGTDLRLFTTRNAGDIDIALAAVQPADPTQVTYILTPTANALRADFPNAVRGLTFEVDGRVSLQVETSGTIFWNETTTPTTFPGDRELDTSDNFNQQSFGPVIATIDPVAEARMTVAVFVADPDFVADGSPTIIEKSLSTGPTTLPIPSNLTLLESTADGTGEGPITAYAGLNASTPDTDGSEQLDIFTIANIPTDWLRDDLAANGTTLLQSAFFTNDPTNPQPLDAAEWAKIASAEFDPATGTLTLTFVPGVTDFNAAFRVTPTLYEDNNVNDTDPEQNFPSVGTFFPGDLTFGVTVIDTDNVPGTDDSARLEAVLNVDVDPVNNTSFVIGTLEGRESVIDGEEPDAGGVTLTPGTFNTAITLGTTDQDGSETIISIVLKDVAQNITVYVLSDPNDPNSPRVPALLENVNDPPGFNSWSLQNGQWNDIQLRGIPRHTAGSFDTEVDIVTKEANGGTGTTTLPVTFTIAPVLDGGNPGETVRGFEDNLVKVAIDGNPIDNINNSPGSPEKLIDQVELFNIPTDQFGRTPEFYILDPVTGDPNDPGTWGPPIGVTGGVLDRALTPDEALNLYLRPGQDSNIDITFQVAVRYVEEIAETDPAFSPPTPPDEITPAGNPVIGTVTVNMIGVADDPIPEAQVADPDDPASGSPNPITRNQVNDIYKPASGPGSDGELAFSYVGWDSELTFALDLRLTSNSLLQSTAPGPVDRTNPDPTVAADAQDLGGLFTEQMFPDPSGGGGTVFDGSETLFYLISGIDPSAGYSFVGGEPVDPTGTTLLFTATGLANLQFVPGPNAQLAPTYYEFTLDAIVVEDDFTLSDGIGITQAQFDALTPAEKFIVLKSPAEPGIAIESTGFSVMVLPDGGPGPTPPCDPDDPEFLTPPTFEFVPVGTQLEDRNNEYRIQLAPDTKWSDLNDIITLPAGVVGSLGVAINLPPGGSISANPPGAIILDPTTGLYVIDFAALGVDPADPTITAGSIFFTPPANQSSPAGFPGGTFGDMPPYDGLDTLEYVVGLDNITCPNSSFFVTQDFFLNIEPVADGPRITIPTQSTDEDASIANLLEISGIDPGERPVGDVIVSFNLNVPNQTPGSSDPDPRLSFGGVALPFTDAGGTRTYVLTAAQAEAATLSTREHYSGNVTFTVQATSEDVDGSTATNTANGSITVIPVADTPVVTFDTSAVGPDGVPLVSFPDGPGNPPTLTAIEDTPFTLADAVGAASPDMDGSETGSIVLSGVPDFLTVTLQGGGSAGLINNGDGSFTIDPAVFDQVVLELSDPHARTPDALNPAIPDEIALTIRGNTLELGNSDQAKSADVPFNLRVRPEADLPTVDAIVLPPTGSEDQPDPYALAILGLTPDPHETMDFTISGIPEGSVLSVGGVDITVGPSGSVTVPGVPFTGAVTGLGSPFEPASPVFLTPPEHFSGQILLDITATSIDSSIDPNFPFTSTQPSAPAVVPIDIAATPDLEIAFTPPVDLFEDGPNGTEDGVDYQPGADTTFTVRDTDGSEILNQVIFTLQNVPAGMTALAPAGGTVTIAGGTLVFTSTIGANAQAEYDALVLNFPQNYSTPGLTGTVRGTTNEGGDVTTPVSIAITPTPDIDITVLNANVDIPESGTGAEYEPATDFTIAITDPDGSEFVQQITYTLDVPAGTSAIAPAGGTVAIAGGVLTFTSTTATAAGQAQAEFNALQVTFPAGFSSGGPLNAQLSVISNETLAFPPEQASMTVTVTEVPEITVDLDAAVVLTETDAAVDYKPSDNATITVNDSDGSELLTSITYVLAGIPPGLSVIGGNAFVSTFGNTLIFTSSSADPLADFQTLELAFPANFASNGTLLLLQTLNATTNEGGNASDTGTLDVLGTPDVDLTVTPVDAAQTGATLAIDLGIDTEITPASNVWETFDEVEISFDAPLDATITPSDGFLSADRRTLTLSRSPAQTNAEFTATVAALVLTAQGTFAGTIDGTIIGRSNHGNSAAEPFSLRINDQPDLSGPATLDAVLNTQATVAVPIAQFLTTATDPDQPLTILTDPTTDQADVTAQIQGTDIVFTIANGYAGPVTVSYTITDSPAGGVPAASIDATADLDVENGITMSFTNGATVIGPDGTPIPLADDVTGTAGVTDALIGTNAAEAVELGGNYAEIEGFQLLGGNDLVDLGGASTTRPFTVDLGAGNDEGRGGGGNDRFFGGEGADILDGAGGNDLLDGGAGADTLTGGAGADRFALSTDLAITDIISDYDLTEGDQIDLSAVLNGEDTVNGRASYDNATGNLTVQGDIAAQLNPGGSLPASVEVIFENAAGEQATAVI